MNSERSLLSASAGGDVVGSVGCGKALAFAARLTGGLRLVLEAATGVAFIAASPTRCRGVARGKDPSLEISPLLTSGDETSACVASSVSSTGSFAAAAPCWVVISELAPEPVLSVIGDRGGMTSEEAELLRKGGERRSNFLLEVL